MYELDRGRAGAHPAQAAAARGLTRFVGRDAELEQLRRAPGAGRQRPRAGRRRRRRAGRGQVAPRLGVHPLPSTARTGSCSRAARSRTARRRPTCRSSTCSRLLPDRGPRRPPQDPREGHREAARASTGPGADAAGAPGAAGRARGRPAVGGARSARSAASARSTRSSGCCFARARCSRSLVVFEDLHWIDAETQALLDSLVESLPTARLLLLVNYRPEYQHAWGSKTYYRSSGSTRCRPRARRSCSRALLGADADARTAQAAADRADRGQSVLPRGERPDAGGDRGARRASAARYRLARPVESLQVPATVQAVLAARIDRLSPEDKRCSGGGGDRQGRAVRAAPARSPSSPTRRCAEGFATSRPPSSSTRRALFPDLEYTFKHALTHEVAYGSLLQERRRALHARIVDGDREALSATAWRARRAARPPCRSGVRCGTRRSAISARLAPRRRRARRIGRRSRTSSRRWTPSTHLPETRETLSRPSTSASTLRSAARPLGESGGMLDHPPEAEGLATASTISIAWGGSSRYMTQHFAVATGQRAVARPASARCIAKHLGDLRARGRRHFIWAALPQRWATIPGDRPSTGVTS